MQRVGGVAGETPAILEEIGSQRVGGVAGETPAILEELGSQWVAASPAGRR